jgi:hypothetical protein
MSPRGLSILRFVFTLTSIAVLCVGLRRGFRNGDPWMIAAYVVWACVFAASLYFNLKARPAETSRS